MCVCVCVCVCVQGAEEKYKSIFKNFWKSQIFEEKKNTINLNFQD